MIALLHVVSHRSVFLSIHVSPSVQTVIAEKPTGFQLTNKFLYCMQPELSLPYIVLKNEIKILRPLKSGKIDFKDCTSPEPDECRQHLELSTCISVSHFETKT